MVIEHHRAFSRRKLGSNAVLKLAAVAEVVLVSANGAVQEECGLIPSKSRVKNAAHARRRAYLECKRKVLEEEADHEPRT